MENDFVPYDRALRLKELGFDEPCFAVFELIVVGDTIPKFRYNWESEDKWFNHNKDKSEYKDHDWYWSAPLYQQAFRWFREKYNLIFQINYLFNGNYQVVIHKNTHEYMNLIQSHPHSCVDEVPDNYSYEEAELACLDKLIEIFNNDN